MRGSSLDGATTRDAATGCRVPLWYLYQQCYIRQADASPPNHRVTPRAADVTAQRDRPSVPVLAACSHCSTRSAA